MIDASNPLFRKLYKIVGTAHAPTRKTDCPEVSPCNVEWTWGVYGNGSGEFNNPGGVALDSSGNVVCVVDTRNYRIQRFTEDGDFELAWGMSCDLIDGRGCVDPDYWGPLDFGDGQFNGPTAVAVDANDDVYVVDQGNERIQKFANDGMFLGWWGTKGPAPGQFIKPSGIPVDATGDAYVSDIRDRVHKFDSCGSPSGAFLDVTSAVLD